MGHGPIFTGKKKVMYIGITCGLSAPVVAGQLDYALDQPHIIPVLIGFNLVRQLLQDSLQVIEKLPPSNLVLQL